MIIRMIRIPVNNVLESHDTNRLRRRETAPFCSLTIGYFRQSISATAP